MVNIEILCYRMLVQLFYLCLHGLLSIDHSAIRMQWPSLHLPASLFFLIKLWRPQLSMGEHRLYSEMASTNGILYIMSM
jgi:hypothetical protein